MTLQIVDGKAIADDIYADLAPRFARLRAARGQASLGRAVKLGIVVAGANSIIESFVRIKTKAAEKMGIGMARTNVSEKSDAGRIIQVVNRLAGDTDAVIVQLPLPQGIDANEILSAVPKEKDVDALNPKIPEEGRPVHAPVALAVVEILKRSGVDVRGKRTVVVGAGRLVGAPSAWLLRELGANVSVFSLEEGSIEDLKDADIVVLGAGNPGFVRPEHIKEGVVLIDAGTSEQGGKVVGDADPACAAKASVFTPVPGGVGPVAVAMIFRNLLQLVTKAD